MNSAPERRPQETASQRFAALAGLPWQGPTDQQRAEFEAWLAAGNARHAAVASGAAARIPRVA